MNLETGNETGDWKLETKLEIGKETKLETEIGDWKLETKLEIGNWKLETENWK